MRKHKHRPQRISKGGGPSVYFMGLQKRSSRAKRSAFSSVSAVQTSAKLGLYSSVMEKLMQCAVHLMKMKQTNKVMLTSLQSHHIVDYHKPNLNQGQMCTPTVHNYLPQTN